VGEADQGPGQVATLSGVDCCLAQGSLENGKRLDCRDLCLLGVLGSAHQSFKEA
jgi:hypothetical protein